MPFEVPPEREQGRRGCAALNQIVIAYCSAIAEQLYEVYIYIYIYIYIYTAQRRAALFQSGALDQVSAGEQGTVTLMVPSFAVHWSVCAK